MTTLPSMVAAAGIVMALWGPGAVAANPAVSTHQGADDLMEVYIYACQPVEYDFGGVRIDLDEAATLVHQESFLTDHGGSCREFYFGEIVPLLDPERWPFFLPVYR
jgi:hypothetical protein